VRIELKWLSNLIQTIIHYNSYENNIKDYMLPGISELQPKRVSWSDNIIGTISGERKLKLSFPGKQHRSSFDYRQSLGTFLVVIIYLVTLLEDEPLGDSTS
jgi:hypothetical protein